MIFFPLNLNMLVIPTKRTRNVKNCVNWNFQQLPLNILEITKIAVEVCINKIVDKNKILLPVMS